MQNVNSIPIVIIGNPTHDCLIDSINNSYFCIGGGVSYGSSVLAGLKISYQNISKVGKNFKYAHTQNFTPTVANASNTTTFINFISEIPRRQIVKDVCALILPQDINVYANISLVSAVLNEVPKETILALRSKSNILIGDIQGFLRHLHSNGVVYYQSPTPYHYTNILSQFNYIKISEEEMAFINLPQLLNMGVKVIITRGIKGSSLHSHDKKIQIPAYNTKEIDTTGAGDCFLAGFAAGVHYKYSEEESLNIASYCGHIAVQHKGVPPNKAFNLGKFFKFVGVKRFYVLVANLIIP